MEKQTHSYFIFNDSSEMKRTFICRLGSGWGRAVGHEGSAEEEELLS